MCGISGVFNFVRYEPVDTEVVRRMADAMVHRGPDEQGVLVDQSLGLGFRRLSIIDLAAGHQPMSDADASVWVILNGEIYNHLELKQELQSYGHRFRTRADTEVIVHGFKQWGLDVFTRLRGMFGVAIWDAQRRRLILARDAMGIKPLYYHVADGQLLFGSEIRAIQSARQEKLEVDPAAVRMFLQYRFTPSPHTVFKGVHKLAAGTMLVAESGFTEVKRWYTYAPKPLAHSMSTVEASEELHSIYRRAVKRHLMSDVPVGLLLSGGVDSGLLLGLMSEVRQGWPTFTVGYGSSFADDELTASSETASHFGATHTRIELDIRTFDESLGHVVSQLEEPVATASTVPMYFLCRRAKDDVTVALSGQGPDELFGGYRRHLGVRYGGLWAQLPAWLRSSAGGVLERLPRNETLKRGLRSLHLGDRMKRYQAVLSLTTHQEVSSLFRAAVLPTNDGAEGIACWEELQGLMSGTDDLGGLQFLEVRSTLPDELLMYTDKMSMAHGLEVRVPFLDLDVVEFVEQLPANLKVRWGVGKWLHRRVCTKHLPASVIRRRKHGFAVNVVDNWLRKSLSRQMEDTFNSDDALMYRILRPDTVRQMLVEHQTGRHDRHKLLFSLVVLEHWLRQQESAVRNTATAQSSMVSSLAS